MTYKFINTIALHFSIHKGTQRSLGKIYLTKDPAVIGQSTRASRQFALEITTWSNNIHKLRREVDFPPKQTRSNEPFADSVSLSILHASKTQEIH